MRIGIDCRSLSEKAGVARYLSNILREWSIIDTTSQYIIYLKGDINHPLFEHKLFAKRIVNTSPIFRKNVLWEQFWLPSVLRHSKPDILFCPSYTAPLITKTKIILTVHDVSYEALPKQYPLRDRLKMKTLPRRATKKAKQIITVSDFSKKEITKYYGIPSEKVKVIPLAADSTFIPQDNKKDLEEIKNKYGIRGKFILYVGAMSGVFARRNVPQLIKTFKKISNPISHHLVLVGKHESGIPQLIKNLKLRKRVTLIDYVSDKDLASLYSAADVFVYLSTYEGFGLPVLEAMACGAPVICSNLSSLPEVAGDAAIFVNPENTEEIASSIRDVLTNETLKIELSQRSLKQAKRFSWQKTAQATLKVLTEVASM